MDVELGLIFDALWEQGGVFSSVLVRSRRDVVVESSSNSSLSFNSGGEVFVVGGAVDWKSYFVGLVAVGGGLGCLLSLRDLAVMFKAQGGVCALSGMRLSFVGGDLCVCCLDRIDYSLGWVVGNVQLVCLWAGRARYRHGCEDLRDVLRRLVELRVGELGVVK